MSISVRSSLGLVALATVALSGCQGGVNPVGPPTGRTISYSQEVQPIYDAHCTSCHSAGGFSSVFSGLSFDLTAGNSHGDTVNQPSSRRADLLLVKPGDAANSLMFLKVSSDAPPVGETMPIVGARLSSEELAILRDWIDQGAADN